MLKGYAVPATTRSALAPRSARLTAQRSTFGDGENLGDDGVNARCAPYDVRLAVIDKRRGDVSPQL